MLNKLQPVHFYVMFISFMLLSRLFEYEVPVVYYTLVIFGWACFFIAVRKYFSGKKSKPKARRK